MQKAMPEQIKQQAADAEKAKRAEEELELLPLSTPQGVNAATECGPAWAKQMEED